MPRNALTQEQRVDYKLKDLKKWIRRNMADSRCTQKDIGKVLGLSQGTVSIMLKDVDGKKKDPRVKEDPISYGQLLKLCEYFGVDEKEKQRLLTL